MGIDVRQAAQATEAEITATREASVEISEVEDIELVDGWVEVWSFGDWSMQREIFVNERTGVRRPNEHPAGFDLYHFNDLVAGHDIAPYPPAYAPQEVHEAWQRQVVRIFLK